jgi:phospholipid-binding lipoprotein MlaA
MSSFRQLAALAAFLVVTGCASMSMTTDVYDPFERENRALFNASLAVDRAVVRPAAIGYRRAVPMRVRDSIRNFLNNLSSPVVFANDVLQGEVDRAGITLVRIGVNSTVGIGGLFDPATGFGFPRHSEDFGQTLAVYGVPEGPYLFIPILGPSNARDLTGFGVDFAFDPLTWIPLRESIWWGTGRQALDDLDLRERTIEPLDEIEKSSIDFYASLRSLYHQNRENEIRNGKPEVEELPNF